MEKFKVSFEANNQQLKALGTKHASDTYADIEATFVLGEKWTDMDSVSAVWWNDFTRIATVLDSQGKCIVPHEVLARKGCVRVNLVGSIVEGDELITRLTSYSAEAVQVNEKIKLTGSETSEITPSQFEQFVQNVKADADRAEAGATASANSADEAEASAQNASESASASAVSASDSARSATASAGYAQNASESAQSAENAKDDAEDARDEILGMRATAETLEAGSDATASYSDGLLTLGIPRGDQGIQGIQGETGATPNLTIGTVETLAPTEDATATITGTAENPVLNLGLPKGDTGEVSQAELDEAITDLKNNIKQIEDCTLPQNLFDASTIVQGGYWSGSGGISANENSYYSEQYIAVEAGVEYTFTDDHDAAYLATYDSSQSFVSRVDPSGNKYTPSSGVSFVRFSMYNRAFPNGFKFAKTSDFANVSDDYKVMLNGAELNKSSIMYSALNDDSVLQIVGNLATQKEITELSKDFQSYTKIVGKYFNMQGDLQTIQSYTLLYFVSPINFTIWGDDGTATQPDDDVMLTKYSSTPLSSSTALMSRCRLSRDSSGAITANTLPTENSPLHISRGEIVAIAYYLDTNFKFHVDGLYDGFVLNENVEVKDKGVSVKVSANSYAININGFDTSIDHEVDAENRKDLWTIRGISKGTRVICSTGTDIIGVLREVGEADFMGGLHGDETNVAFYILGDGKPIVTDGIFNQVDVLMYSHLTRPSTGENVIDRIVHLIFKDNHIDVENTFVCLVSNFNLDFAYNGGLFAWYDADADFQMSNIGIIDSNIGNSGVTLQASHELYSATALIGDSVITVENIIGHENSSYLGETYYYGNSDKRIKMYYSTEHNVTWNNGHICKGKARYTLN